MQSTRPSRPLPPVSLLIAAVGLLMLLGAMVIDAAVTRLGDYLLVAIMIAGLMVMLGGVSGWLDAQD